MKHCEIKKNSHTALLMGRNHTTNHFYHSFDTETFPTQRDKRPDDYRTAFQVDRDRITYSAAFRRLQSKTQVFQSGEYDFYRTRLTHSIEVAHVGRAICHHLNYTSPLLTNEFFIDPDLVEGICLAHDLGHPPFGHIGERKLNDLMGPYGGFEGNAQTLRTLTELIYYQGNKKFSGMKPTRAFLDGVLKYKALFHEMCTHNTEGKHGFPTHHFIYDQQEPILTFVYGDQLPPINDRGQKSIECQIMDWADDTAYSLHDIIDGIHAGFINPIRLKQWASQKLDSNGCLRGFYVQKALETLLEAIMNDNIEWCFSKRIGDFIHACTLEPYTGTHPLSDLTTRYRFQLHIDPQIIAECELYKAITFDLIFTSPALQRYEFKGSRMLEKLFLAIYEHYIAHDNGLKILPEVVSDWLKQGEPSKMTQIRRICDYLADLTDRQAIQAYKRLYHPDFGSLTDLG
jgi:dGTPase